MSPASAGGTEMDSWGRAQLSNLYGLFVLSMMMFDGREAADILRLAATSVPSLSPCSVDAMYLLVDGELVRRPGDQRADVALDTLVNGLDGDGGQISLPDDDWRWAFILRGLGGVAGCLVVRSVTEPATDQFFLLKVLAQQTAAALGSAALHRREREQGIQLRKLSDERAAANVELSKTVESLKRQTNVHQVLTTVSASGAGEPGIAHALHELTGLPVAIEDQFGNLRAWSGPDRPDPYPKPTARRREELLRQVAAHGRPLWEKDRLVSLVKPRHEILGVVTLIDPRRQAGDYETFALEYGTTVLALELAHQRNLAEAELRMRRDLVDDLIAGTDDESAFARSDAAGHDLRGPHHVAVVQWRGHRTDDAVAEAVGHAVTRLQLRALSSRRAGLVILLTQDRPNGEELHRIVAAELGSRTGAIGIGSRCDTPGDIPRSYSEALRALDIRQKSRSPHGSTSFEQLGLYRILDTGESREEIEGFVREWLGKLLDYDAQKHADLVRTLSQYLECGGSYDEAAAALVIHRSTLRYRLGRIKEITELDLNDVDSRLNLHVATRAWQVLQGRS
jgi:sugar diacid utilization regulator